MRGRPEPYENFCSFFGETRALLDLEHHLCRAHQAFYASPFDEAAVVTIDGMGGIVEPFGNRAVSTTMAEGNRHGITVRTAILRPSSVGAMYRNITRYLGFDIDQDSHTMALAAYGTDRFYRRVRDMTLDLFDDGTFDLREDFFQPLFEFCPRRAHDAPLDQEHFDVAWACQQLAEDAVVHVARSLHRQTGQPGLAMAGRTAQNPGVNARILRESGFDSLFVAPNAADSGLSLGAAMYGYYVVLGGSERHPPAHDFFGPPLDDVAVPGALRAEPGTAFRPSDDVAADVAELLAHGRIVGWMQGGAEFGPRGLGHRSILADPRTIASKERLDREIKRREWFRPYTASVLAERADEYFEMLGPSPSRLVAVDARPLAREQVPGVVHVDGTARVQTVDRAVDARFHRLISRFDDLAGVPVVLNTSFAGHGEPMVESPEDAVRSMHEMGLDAVAVGDYLAWRDGTSP
jgi:carbamoyltransferase